MGGSRAQTAGQQRGAGGGPSGDLDADKVKVEASSKQKEVPTVAELRAVIPKDCFQHSIPHSLLLVLRDFLVMASIFFLATSILRLPGTPGGLAVWEWVGWSLYAFAEGSAFVGWWVLAHECGHGGFSANKTLNDCVGWVLHSLLLVPYFSWQFSHAKHHSKTNHLIDGESHVPDTQEEVECVGFGLIHKVLGDDCFAVMQLFNHLVIGWPMYLIFNVTGGRRLNGKEIGKPVPVEKWGLVDHFRPNSALFPDHWRVRIGLSTLGVALTLAGLTALGYCYGTKNVLVLYGMPYMWSNFWLVLYTWMQHTDPSVPHYGDEDWTWVKGALGTIDRPYGIFDWMHHYIGSTHVCHHLFSTLPCYKAVEATKHLKAFLEPKGLYNYDDTPWPLAAWRVAKTCHYVDGVHGTQYYRSFGSKPKKV